MEKVLNKEFFSNMKLTLVLIIYFMKKLRFYDFSIFMKFFQDYILSKEEI